MTQPTETVDSTPAVSRYVVPSEDFLSHPSPPECAQIIRGDALQVLSQLPADSVDLIHTSPPYNIEKPYASSVTDNAPLAEYVDFLSSAIVAMKRVIRPGGSIFWQTGYTQDDDTTREVVPIDHLSHDLFRNGGQPFTLWDRIIWRYWGGHAFTKKFTNKHETIMWYVKPGEPPCFDVNKVRERAKSYDKRNNLWGRNPGNVWEVDRVAHGTVGQTSHIAVFPEEISERIVRACSTPGDLILDPFSGSGTVPYVARSLSRHWLGIEISPTYANESAVRVGRQQPSEQDALASELLIGLALHAGDRSCRIHEAAEQLTQWIQNVPRTANREEIEEDVRALLANNNGRTRAKADLWRKYDDRIGQPSLAANSPIAIADSLLCKRYKLRRHFNGVSRFKSALDSLDGIAAALTRESPVSYTLRLLNQEPSTYFLHGDLIDATLNIKQSTQPALTRHHQGQLL